MRVAANRPATLRFHLVDEGGTVVSPDSGHNPTVTVTAGDGTTVLYLAQAAAFNGTDNAWEWPFPPQTHLDRLSAVWSTQVAGVSWAVPLPVDVVAERLTEPWILRNGYPELAALTTEQLLLLLDQAEELIRESLGYAPVLEGDRPVWDEKRGTLNDSVYTSGTLTGLPFGWGAGKMLIPGVRFPVQVYGGTINGVALDPVNDIPMLSTENGCLIWKDYRTWVSGRYALWVTHGRTDVPRDLRWACGKLVNHFAQTSDFPDRAWQVSTQHSTISFSMPGPGRPTGIPEVDAVLARYMIAGRV